MHTSRRTTAKTWRSVIEAIAEGPDDLVTAIYTVDEALGLGGVLARPGLHQVIPTFEIDLGDYPCLGGDVDLTPCAHCPVAGRAAGSCHHIALGRTGGHAAFLVVFSPQAKEAMPALKALARLLARIVCSGIDLEQSYGSRVTKLSSLVGELLADLQGPGSGGSARELARLSPREREVLEAFGRLGRIPAVAKELCISPHTVRKHVKSIFRKLGVHSQAELLAYLRTVPVLERHGGTPPLAPSQRAMAKVASGDR